MSANLTRVEKLEGDVVKLEAEFRTLRVKDAESAEAADRETNANRAIEVSIAADQHLASTREMGQPTRDKKRGRGVKQPDLEAINAKLRGAVVEELVTSDDADDSVILSFVDDTPDLLLRPVGNDRELELRFLS
jgi:hypothetical protein